MNKPVAWYKKDSNDYLIENIGQPDFQVQEFIDAGYMPLYTHPVKEYKEPSVKEIEDLWLYVVNNIPANDHRPREWHFAKAILRKASEK